MSEVAWAKIDEGSLLQASLIVCLSIDEFGKLVLLRPPLIFVDGFQDCFRMMDIASKLLLEWTEGAIVADVR